VCAALNPVPCSYTHHHHHPSTPCNPTTDTAPPAAARAALALGGSSARLRVLSAALWGGQLGLADPLMTALQSAPDYQDSSELQLLCALVLALEELATKHAAATAAAAEAAEAAAATGAAASGGEASALAGAVELTKLHLSSTAAEPEPEAPAAAAAWRSLRELCWCGETRARAAAARWLQQLMGAAIEFHLEVSQRAGRRDPGGFDVITAHATRALAVCSFPTTCPSPHPHATSTSGGYTPPPSSPNPCCCAEGPRGSPRPPNPILFTPRCGSPVRLTGAHCGPLSGRTGPAA